jgi:hypothetical protein
MSRKKIANEQTVTLDSGRVVVIRLMTVEEYEANEDKRFAAMEKAAEHAREGRHDESALTLARYNREARRERFALCVPTWSELRSDLTTAEMNDLGRKIESASWPSVAEGNLSAGGDGRTSASE